MHFIISSEAINKIDLVSAVYVLFFFSLAYLSWIKYSIIYDVLKLPHSARVVHSTSHSDVMLRGRPTFRPVDVLPSGVVLEKF